MVKVRINSLQCITPDEIDKDEIYLKIKNKKMWPKGGLYHKMDAGNMVNIGLSLELNEGWNEIELWDYDFITSNDLLGVFKFKIDDTFGKYSTIMKTLERDSTANYVLFWEIIS